MRNNVEIYTTSLLHAIHDSREFREYEKIRSILADNTELRAKINAYRKENYRLQNYGDVETLFQDMEDLQKRNEELLNNPLVTEYLNCELAVCRMLQDVTARVVGSVDLDLEGIAGDIRA